MRTCAVVTAVAAVAAVAMSSGLTAQATLYEHRVVVPTTMLRYELDVAASLERNVNALGARGYELTTLVGGDPAVLDGMLRLSSPSSRGQDETAVVMAVMARAVGVRGVAREYKLLHVRERETTATVVAPLGAQGYRLKFVEFTGEVAHVVFEKIEGASPVEFREFRNRFRSSWMDQLLADADVRARMTRVLPVALGAGIVELGPPQGTPGEVSWLSRPTHAFEQLEDRIRDLAKAGHRVELVRRRGPNDVDVLMFKPAGVTTSSAQYDLDDGPWGSPCSRGTIAGAAVGPDGDVYCAADRGGPSPAANRGLDLTVRPQPSAGGAVLFRGPTCDIRARLESTRAAGARVAFALQFEREIAAAIQPGFRVVRALAASDSNQQARIVAFTTDGAVESPRGPAADPSPAPPLVAELDSVGDDLARQREATLNAALAARGAPGSLWLELSGGRAGTTARLLGCVASRLDRDTALSAANGVLINQGLAHYKVDNRVVVDR